MYPRNVRALGPKDWSHSVWKSTSEVENAQCDSATRTIPCMVHGVHEVWQRFPPPTTSQPHWHRCTAVLAHGWRLYSANDAACKAQNTALVAAPNCMHWLHAVQCAAHALNIFARHWRSRWCLKLIYGMSIVLQGPTFSDSATALISECSRLTCQRKCRQEVPSLRMKSTAKFFLQAASAVCPSNDGRRKVDRKGTSAGQIS